MKLLRYDNKNQQIGSGMIGELKEPMKAKKFLKFVKEAMDTPMIRHTALLDKTVQRIAVCGGAGSFLLNKAIGAQADVFVTADYKYHQFFDADNQIIIADIGHYENEQYTIDLIANELKKKFSSFAFLLTDTNTNPINYL